LALFLCFKSYSKSKISFPIIYSNYFTTSRFYSKGLNCCSDTSISFHYMSVKEIVKLSSIIKDFNVSDSNNSQNLTFKHILDNFILFENKCFDLKEFLWIFNSSPSIIFFSQVNNLNVPWLFYFFNLFKQHNFFNIRSQI